MTQEKIEIPFGANDSELKGWEYTIPEGMEATIENGKVIVRQKESDDERIRDCIGVILTDAAEQRFTDFGVSLKDCLAWLEKQRINAEGDFARGYDCGYECCLNSHGAEWFEKQKEQSITVNDLDEEIHRFFEECINIHEAKLYGNISEMVIPVVCYEATARHFAKWSEKQKEQEHICDSAQYEEGFKTGLEIGLRKRKEQKSNIELIQRSWYMEGYHDREFNMEPMWTVKAEKGGPRYYENPNYGKPLEQKEQKPADTEQKVRELLYASKQCVHTPREIDFADKYSHQVWEKLMAKFDAIEGYKIGANDVSDIVLNAILNTFKFIAEQKSVEWSEEDERVLKGIIDEIEANKNDAPDYDIPTYNRFLSWLKSLRPQPKQEWSEEDEKMRNLAIEWAETMSGQFSFVDMDPTDFRKIATWLKSLHTRFT